MSFTVNNFVSHLVGGANSGATTISISSGHTVGVIVQERNFTGLATGTVTDSAGNTYSVGRSVTNNVYISTAFYSIGVPGALTSVTYTTGTSGTNAFLVYVWDVTATGTISFADAQGVIGTSVSTANGITTGSMTVTSADALLLAAVKDWASGGITAGTGFTADSSVEPFGEHKAVTASAAATFTDAGSGSDYGCMGLAFQVSSGGLTLALTGQRSTFAGGTLAPSSSKALVGQSATSTAGTLAPSLSKALLGSSGTFTAGTLSPSTTVALVGTLVNGGTGIVVPSGGTGGDLTIALTGQRSAFAQGALGVSITVALSGSTSTGTSGTVQPGTSPALVGSSATSSTGLMTPSLAVGLLGQALTGTAGIIAPSVSFALNGNLGSFSQGSLAPSTSVNLVGISNSTNAGQMVSSGGDIINTQTASMLLIRRGFRKKR